MAAAISLVLLVPSAAAPLSDTDPKIALNGISHAVEGRSLVISGWVENQGPRPVSRLVIDATGYGPEGNPAFFGSDGVPWQIAPGGAERFSIRLPLADQPVRDYVVQVTTAQQPGRLLASTRRTVDVWLYRSLLLSIVRVTGDLRAGILTVSSDVRGWPVTHVTVEVAVIVPRVDKPARLDAVTVDVPAGGSTRIGIGVDAMVLSLRVIDVRLKSVWSG